MESFPVTWNMHFFLQVAFCGAPLDSLPFDFVGVMNATFNEQLDVLRRHPKAPPAFQDAVTVRFVLPCQGRRAVLVVCWSRCDGRTGGEGGGAGRTGWANVTIHSQRATRV